jgi:glyoxylase-like metal-dependent hydrolase (beta-lactamase superfamily II)
MKIMLPANARMPSCCETWVASQVLRFTDSCHAYAVLSGEEAVLIDFGDGGLLSSLEAMRVRPTDVLMTHHHRDQGQGLTGSSAGGLRVWAPQAERDLFEKVDDVWQQRELYNNYNVRQDLNSLLEPVRLAGVLRDYQRFCIGDHNFTILPTPGHTPGSISVLTEIGGKKIAFTGDLIAAPGKVWSLSATQWTYNGAEGVAASIAALLDLRDWQPDLLLPSHGDPIHDPIPAIDLLIKRLLNLLQARGENPRLMDLHRRPYEPLTPHLLRNRTSTATGYVLLSVSGKALLFDFGYDFMTGAASGADRAARRPWLHSLPALRRDFGVERIEAAIPTHYHDDHVAGLNLLREVEGAQVWCPQNFAAVLESPSEYDLPCLWFDPIPVDRRLPLGEPLEWEEYTFWIHPLPGHTSFGTAIALEVDGRRVMMVGDQYRGDEGVNWNYVYRNRFKAADYARSADLMRSFQPDLVLTGHWEPVWVKPGYLEKINQEAAFLETIHHDLLVESEPVAFIEPFQTSAVGGTTLEFKVEVECSLNPGETVTLRPAVPDGWKVLEKEIVLRPSNGSLPAGCFHVTPPFGFSARRARIAVDVSAGQRHFGQLAHALVDVTYKEKVRP